MDKRQMPQIPNNTTRQATFKCRNHSVHTAIRLGIEFESEYSGVFLRYYGFPYRHWLLLIHYGHRTFGIGFEWTDTIVGYNQALRLSPDVKNKSGLGVSNRK